MNPCVVSHARDPAAVEQNGCHIALLDDVDAVRIGRRGAKPQRPIVTRNARRGAERRPPGTG